MLWQRQAIGLLQSAVDRWEYFILLARSADSEPLLLSSFAGSFHEAILVSGLNLATLDA